MQLLETDVRIGEVVYLTADSDQKKYLVTGYLIRQDSLKYILSHNGSEDYFYDFEFSKERDVISATS